MAPQRRRRGRATRRSARTPPGPRTAAPVGRLGRLAAHADRLREIRGLVVSLRSDNVELARENARLRRDLAKTLDLSVASPAFAGGLGGRTAIEVYRNVNVGKFIQHVNEAGAFAAAHGSEVCRFFLSSIVRADLACLYAAPPATLEEGIRRDQCERMLATDEGLLILSGTTEASEAARRDWIAQVLGSGVDTSTQELVRRSGEVLAATRQPRMDMDAD